MVVKGDGAEKSGNSVRFMKQPRKSPHPLLSFSPPFLPLSPPFLPLSPPFLSLPPPLLLLSLPLLLVFQARRIPQRNHRRDAVMVQRRSRKAREIERDKQPKQNSHIAVHSLMATGRLCYYYTQTVALESYLQHLGSKMEERHALLGHTLDLRQKEVLCVRVKYDAVSLTCVPLGRRQSRL